MVVLVLPLAVGTITFLTFVVLDFLWIRGPAPVPGAAGAFADAVARGDFRRAERAARSAFSRSFR